MMGPRKSASNWSSDQNYPAVLRRLCQEEDVLVIPEFVALARTESLDAKDAPKARERVTEKHESWTAYSDGESNDESEPDRPPQVHIKYENVDDNENPLSVICKNIYIEFSLVHAIGKSLATFPSVESLKIEDCCISKELAEALAAILAEESSSHVSDLSLDGNLGLDQMLPLFVSPSNSLKFVSFQRCGLDDQAVKLLAKALEYTGEKEQKILILNLAMNKIGDVGASHLATALRTNRTLMSLSLAGNQIGDEGVFCLTEILHKFPLLPDEIAFRRRRIFDKLVQKNATVNKFFGEFKGKGDAERETSKTSTRGTERFTATGRKIRGPDGRMCLATSKDKKGKLANAAKLNSGEKFAGRIRNDLDDGRKHAEVKSAEFLPQIDGDITPDKHPFVNETFPSGGQLWCIGCWSLLNINLAYNYLTGKSAQMFADVITSQSQDIKIPKCGLLRVVLTPGNLIASDSTEIQNLQNVLMMGRNSKEGQSDASLAIAVGSKSPTRKLNSSARK